MRNAICFLALALGACLASCGGNYAYAQDAPAPAPPQTKAERMAQLENRQGRLLAIYDMSKLDGNVVQEDFAEQLVDDVAAEIAALAATPDDQDAQPRHESLRRMPALTRIGYAQGAPARYRHHGQAPLNDLDATPGAADPQLTKARLCDPKFHTGTARNVTESQKRRICLEYGIADGCPGKAYEIDHLVSIELGGANLDANLWPQPADAPGLVGFHTKDVVENRAHKAVCDGKLALAEAQAAIRTDWYAFGLKNGFLEPGGR